MGFGPGHDYHVVNASMGGTDPLPVAMPVDKLGALKSPHKSEMPIQKALQTNKTPARLPWQGHVL